MRYNGNKFSVYESEEKTVLGLLDELGSQVNHNTDNFKNKTDLYGDHKGSWQGLSKPTLSEEGMRATVEKIINTDIPCLSNRINDIVFDIEQYKTEEDGEYYDNAIKRIIAAADEITPFFDGGKKNTRINISMRSIKVKDTIVINKPYLSFSGESQGEMKATIVADFINKPLFLVQNTGFSLNNVRVKGVNNWDGNFGSLTNIGILYQPNDLNGVDSLIYNTTIEGFKTAIDCKGRNLRVTDCLIAECRDGIILRKGSLGDNSDIRTTYIKRNHFHVVGDTNPSSAYNTDYILKVEDETENADIIFSDNFIDGNCNGIFSGYGNGVIIKNNTFSNIGGGNTCIDVKLNSNLLKPFIVEGNCGNTTNSNIFIYSETKFKNAIIQNNTVTGVNRTFIYVINVENSVIKNNNFITTKRIENIINILNNVTNTMITGNFLCCNFSTPTGLNIGGSQTSSMVDCNLFR